MNWKKEIIKTINSIAGKYSAYEVFTDWIKMYALSISNSVQLFQDKIWKDRDQAFHDTARKYTDEEMQKMVAMRDMLVYALSDEMTDILGQVYMESGMGSKAAGQFFTPFHLSLLCARMALKDAEPDERGIYRISEPSCGGGGMIIAAAVALKEQGVDFQRKMEVVAQDLDWKGVYMCYLQLSLLGIRATVVQGNTLSEPYRHGYPPERVLYTPAKRGMVI